MLWFAQFKLLFCSFAVYSIQPTSPSSQTPTSCSVCVLNIVVFFHFKRNNCPLALSYNQNNSLQVENVECLPKIYLPLLCLLS